MSLKRGYNLDKIKGILTDCYTGMEKEVQFEYKFKKNEHENTPIEYWLLVNGPTGFESIDIDTISEYFKSNKDWLACAGTEKKWDKLIIQPTELKRIYQVFNEMIAKNQI